MLTIQHCHLTGILDLGLLEFYEQCFVFVVEVHEGLPQVEHLSLVGFYFFLLHEHDG